MESTKRNVEKAEVVAFKLEGLGCSCEAKIVEKRIRALNGVKSFDINPISNRVKISYDPSVVSTEDIKKAIHKCGLKALS
ncbi:heavy-metal-associated domain-containing protein [Candidatus Bathyarchaeota archaeon]|nr:heavy-metal-associated domain-containing protein [Candidatus Bathyarchaeota archaeon]